MVFVFKNKAYIAHRNITKVQVDENTFEIKISGLLHLLGKRDNNARRELIIHAGSRERAIALAEPLLSSLHAGYCFFMYVEHNGDVKNYSLYQDLSKQFYNNLPSHGEIP